MTSATDLFLNEGIWITRQGRRQLGAALGSRSFTEEYVTSKVAEWIKEVENLATIAACQPHAAYTAFTQGLSGKWTHLTQTVSGTNDLFEPLEEVI